MTWWYLEKSKIFLSTSTFSLYYRFFFLSHRLLIPPKHLFFIFLFSFTSSLFISLLTVTSDFFLEKPLSFRIPTFYCYTSYPNSLIVIGLDLTGGVFAVTFFPF